MSALTEAQIRAAKPKEKPYKLFDERGLFMLVTATGRPAVALPVPPRWGRKATGSARTPTYP